MAEIERQSVSSAPGAARASKDSGLARIKTGGMMKLNLRAIVMFFFTTLFFGGTAKTQATDHFVSMTGAATWASSTNKGTPCSLATALEYADDGDVVHLRAGTYKTTVRPAHSGSAGNYISFTTYANEAVAISGVNRGADLSQRSYIKITGLYFGNMESNGGWINFEPNGDRNIIENCVFSSTSDSMAYSGGILLDGDALNSCDYNIFRGNSFSALCTPKDGLRINLGRYNLIENNYFGIFSHTPLNISSDWDGITEFNVVRNNTLRNELYRNVSLYNGGSRTLFERNISEDPGIRWDENRCGDGAQDDPDNNPLMQVASSRNIIRFNQFGHNGELSFSSWKAALKYCEYNKFYNNTCYQATTGLHFFAESAETHPFDHNHFINSIFAESYTSGLFANSANFTTATTRIHHNNFYSNPSYTYKGVSGLDTIQREYPDEVFENRSLDPKFTNAAIRDFRLQPSSRMIDAAAWLTVTSASGSGNKIGVDDANYFMDGWGIINGDLIQLEGQTQTARVIAVNYDTNEITVNNSLSWTKGQGVSLPYNGLKPDIGAYEYQESATPAPVAPRGLTVR